MLCVFFRFLNIGLYSSVRIVFQFLVKGGAGVLALLAIFRMPTVPRDSQDFNTVDGINQATLWCSGALQVLRHKKHILGSKQVQQNHLELICGVPGSQ